MTDHVSWLEIKRPRIMCSPVTSRIPKVVSPCRDNGDERSVLFQGTSSTHKQQDALLWAEFSLAALAWKGRWDLGVLTAGKAPFPTQSVLLIPALQRPSEGMQTCMR